MAASKGTVWLSTKLFVEKRFGKAVLDDCFGRLPEDDRKLLGGVVPVGWYPIEPTLRFHRIVDERLGDGNLSLCREMGAFSADWQLNSFHKLFLRFQRPAFLVERATQMWSTYHDTGRWELDVAEERRFDGRLVDFAVPDPVFAVRLEGWLRRAFELCGARDVRVQETRLRDAGGSVYEYVGSWS